MAAFLRSRTVWDWFFVPLWVLCVLVFLFGAQAVFGGNLYLMGAGIIYVLATIPYFIGKDRNRKESRPKQEGPGRHDAFAVESQDPSENALTSWSRVKRKLGNLSFPIEILFVIVVVAVMVVTGIVSTVS